MTNRDDRHYLEPLYALRWRMEWNGVWCVSGWMDDDMDWRRVLDSEPRDSLISVAIEGVEKATGKVFRMAELGAANFEAIGWMRTSKIMPGKFTGLIHGAALKAKDGELTIVQIDGNGSVTKDGVTRRFRLGEVDHAQG